MAEARDNGHTTPDRRRSKKPSQPLFRHRGGAIVAVGPSAVLNLGVILVANSDTTPGGKAALPTDIESISPENGALAGLVDDVTVNLRDNLTGVLVIDGVEIPEDQLKRVQEPRDHHLPAR